MNKCQICASHLTGQQTKYCSTKCQTKAWKIKNRATYLAGKKQYAKNNREKILAYKREYNKLGVRPLDSMAKAKIIKAKGSKCYRCGSENNLHIHHIKQLRFGGTNADFNLMVLCHKCHTRWHKLMKGFWEL